MGRHAALIVVWLVVVEAAAVDGAVGLAAGSLSSTAATGGAATCAAEIAPPAAGAPWGELVRRAIVLAPSPEEWPLDRTLPAASAWRVGDADDGAALGRILAAAGVDARAAAALIAAARPAPGGGMAVDAPLAVRLGFPRAVRATLYRRLALDPANADQICAQRWTAAEYARWRADARVAPTTLAAFDALVYDDDGLVAFADAPALCASIADPDERRRLLCALVRAPALMVSVRLRGGAADDEAIRWWSAGDPNVARLMRAQGGDGHAVEVDLAELLPPVPRARLNRYPDGDELRCDCGWTALNFFRAQPDPTLSDPAVVAVELRDRYRVVQSGEPLRYGDILLFALPDGRVQHAAVYLADDLFFTKNGATTMRPWKISDLATLRVRYHAAPRLTALRATPAAAVTPR